MRSFQAVTNLWKSAPPLCFPLDISGTELVQKFSIRAKGWDIIMAATTSSFVGMGERPGVPPVNGLPRVTARIGKYEVEAEIGQSATVKVFRALDRDTGRPV